MYILGIDPNRVYDSLEVPGANLGQLGCDHSGNIFVFLKAATTVNSNDCVIIHEDGTASAVTTTLAAAATGQGKMLAVGPSASKSQAIAQNDYFWGLRYSIGRNHPVDSTALAVNVKGATAKFTQLYTCATAGHLDDAFVAGGQVVGLVTTTLAGTADQAEVAYCNWPVVVHQVDTATGGGG
jgi:hypothetical protein